jgi:PST family polysaccharide transporter
VVAARSRGVRLSDFTGAFDRTEFRKLLGFYPMLLVNGALAPLTLILVRDVLASRLGLDAAGQWQAAWRLSESYQAVILSSTSLYFMPSLGERVGRPAELRRQVGRTLGLVLAATATLALAIGLLRQPIVQVVFSGRFHLVAGLLPLQLLGDVLKMGGWIFAMVLVATMRTRSYIALSVLSMLCFVGLAHVLVGLSGVEGAVQAYVATGALQIVAGAFLLRDVLSPRSRSAASASVAGPQ